MSKPKARQGLDAESRVLLGQIGQYLATVRMPCIIGGDWKPRKLEAWGWPREVGGFIVNTGTTDC